MAKAKKLSDIYPFDQVYWDNRKLDEAELQKAKNSMQYRGAPTRRSDLIDSSKKTKRQREYMRKYENNSGLTALV
jgi:hypothetical protein